GFGMAGYVLNDIWDRAADRVNRPGGERPLALGRVSRGTADLCVAGGALVGLGAAALVNGTAVLSGFAALAVLALYSPVLKRRGLPGNVAVAVVAGLPLMYGAIAVGRAAAGIVPWTLAAWIHLVREIVKDIDDQAGDRALDRRTLPLVLGPQRASVVAAALAAAFVPLSLALPAGAPVPRARLDLPSHSRRRRAGRPRGDGGARRSADRGAGTRRTHVAFPGGRRLARHAAPPGARRAGRHVRARRARRRRCGRRPAGPRRDPPQMAERRVAGGAQARGDPVRRPLARRDAAMAGGGRGSKRPQRDPGGRGPSGGGARGMAPRRPPTRCPGSSRPGARGARIGRAGPQRARVRRVRGA